VETTPEHPFHTAEGEWAPAGEPQVGGQVLKTDGAFGWVKRKIIGLAGSRELCYDGAEKAE